MIRKDSVKGVQESIHQWGSNDKTFTLTNEWVECVFWDLQSLWDDGIIHDWDIYEDVLVIIFRDTRSWKFKSCSDLRVALMGLRQGAIMALEKMGDLSGKLKVSKPDYP